MLTSPVSRLVWEPGNERRWYVERRNAYLSHVVFELCGLPDFAAPRFAEFGEKLDERRAEVARHQLQMLRQLHSLGDGVAVTLRLRRDGNRLRLFIVASQFDAQPAAPAAVQTLAARLLPLFPKEYNLSQVSPETQADTWRFAFDLAWVTHIEELFKPEETLQAHVLPYFYVPMRWQPQQSNTLEQVCRTLLRFHGDAVIDLTLIPTSFMPLEREWVSGLTQEMRDQLSGKRLVADGGRTGEVFPALPHLQAPLENYQELLKNYPQSRLFLTGLRVLADAEPSAITQALIASATRSAPQVVSLDDRHRLFPLALQAIKSGDIAPEVHPGLWNRKVEDLPMRGQRLHRLADLEEIAGFWRLPIPMAPGFPGFELDTGLGDGGAGGNGPHTPHYMQLGALADDPASPDLPAQFEREALAKHGLVVGTPGSGKTTAMFNLLHQLWPAEPTADRVPFIVLEPAKTEYRALRGLKGFDQDLLVFTLGDESISPFRFNPLEVPAGIRLESHIARLNACFTGAFNLFDPLPLLLDLAIRRTYEICGWFDDSLGGEPGLEPPTLTDLSEQARLVARSSGYSDRVRDDFNAALTQRLESLRRGSKGRMLDVRHSLPPEILMQRPIVLELDALNEDEKALLMMFVLTFVYEYARANRPSGSPLGHVLLVEEAHNLIGRATSGHSEYRANPREQAIHLFTRMLAEMRALGQGILIADQLPTALAPEVVKQTNLKILMRMTALDDRTEMGNTMDLDEAQLKGVTHFKAGQAYVFLEEWTRVRLVQTANVKENFGLTVPQSDAELAAEMKFLEEAEPGRFMPFDACHLGCTLCERRVRSQAERFSRDLASGGQARLDAQLAAFAGQTLCAGLRLWVASEEQRLFQRYGQVAPVFPFCAYLHLKQALPEMFKRCRKKQATCQCRQQEPAGEYRAWLPALSGPKKGQDQAHGV
jgi:hypothetical protein